jgi:GTP-binding protein
VPPGTIVYDVAYNFVLKDLASEGETIIAAKGGAGGKGNLRFKTATNRAPRTATPGEPAEMRRVRLELKMIADVGLIGKPNAGKSTLLSCVSRARPEIASYPFTTKYPNLGLVSGYGDRTFIMADIPGLIEGAHRGVGLGHDFLRHIQRAGILIHLVEPLPDDGTQPWDNYRAIRQELELFDPLLGQRPELVVITKADLPEAADVRSQFAEQLGKTPFLICSISGDGLPDLLQAIQAQLAPPLTW